jgi:diguanylate cyclase (GGDEF)-like protein
MREIPPVYDHDLLADAALTPEQRAYWLQFREAQTKLQQRVAELQTKLEQDEADQIGMILSRPDFNREVARLLALEERYGGTSSIVYFNCDNLDSLTQQHGRNVTNAAIRILCDSLIKHVRACDIVGRLDQNEFGVLLVRCGNDDAWRKGEGLSVAMQAAVQMVHNHPFALSVSYGAYSFAGRDDVATGLQSAAKAMLSKARS